MTRPLHSQLQTCPVCRGAGKCYKQLNLEIRTEDQCQACNGTGRYTEYCAVKLAGESAILPRTRILTKASHAP